jgi:flagellar hook-associated protein 3 FlgL
MRIATSQFQSTMNQSLALNQERLSHLTQQMASGNRILTPSDDPVDSVRLSRLRREEAAVGQYRANIATIQIRLRKTEGYLDNMVTDIHSGRDLMVWALDGGNTPDDLAAMVTPLTSLRDSLFHSANTVDQEGRYIFSGTQTTTAPLKYDPTLGVGSRYTYQGNANAQMVVVGNGISQVGNENVEGLEKLLNEIDLALDALAKPGASPNDPAVRTVLAAGLTGFDDALNMISSKIAVLGGSQNILKTLDANHANVSLSNKMALTDIGQLDMGVAATELSGYTTALQATYKAYSRISGLSLFSAL